MAKKKGNYHFVADHVEWHVSELLHDRLGLCGVLLELTTWQPARIIFH